MEPYTDLFFVLPLASKKVEERLREKKQHLDELEEEIREIEKKYNKLPPEVKTKIENTKQRISVKKEIITNVLNSYKTQ